MPLTRKPVACFTAFGLQVLTNQSGSAAQTARDTVCTVGEVIEDAVRDALRPRATSAQAVPELPTYGGSGVLPGVDLGDARALRDVMDEGEPIDALR